MGLCVLNQKFLYNSDIPCNHIGMFVECSAEVYETVGTVWVEESSGRNFVRMIGYGKV